MEPAGSSATSTVPSRRPKGRRIGRSESINVCFLSSSLTRCLELRIFTFYLNFAWASDIPLYPEI